MQDRVDTDGAELRTVHAFLALDTPSSPPSVSARSQSPVSRRDSSMVSDTKPCQVPIAWCPRMINLSRERRKNEIRRLREQYIALQQRLILLMQGDDTSTEDTEHVMREAWQTVAQDQRVQREDSERTQAMLRRLVRNNKRSLQHLQRYLQRIKIPDGIVQPLHPTIPWPDEEASFAEIGRSLKTMAAQLDAVFHSSQLEGLTDSFQYLGVENDMTPSLTVKARNSRLVPFDFETTAQAVWVHSHSREALFPVDANEILHHTIDSMRRRFTVSLNFHSFRGTAIACSETQRFVQNGHHVILHVSTMLRNDGFRSEFRSWTIVRSRKTSVPMPGESVSEIESVETIEPRESCAANLKDEDELQNVRAFCVEASEFMQRAERQAIENMVLDLKMCKRENTTVT